MNSQRRKANAGQSQCELTGRPAPVSPSAFHLRDWKRPLPQPLRGGMTLIELLIVIVILATLTAAALPLLTPSTMERRIREASRGLNMYIAQAQAKAVSSQRPYGVALKRLSAETGNADDAGVCLEVISVEQPVPYAGFDENSRIRVALNDQNFTAASQNYAAFETVLLELVTRSANNAAPVGGLPAGWVPDMLPPNFLRYGDVVEVLGTRYQIVGEKFTQPATVQVSGYLGGNTASNAAQLVVIPLNATGQALKPVVDSRGFSQDPNTGAKFGPSWFDLARQGGTQPPVAPYWTEPAPYKIYRQPVPTSADPYQMPEGSAIDLEVSGIMGELPFHVLPGDGSAVMISPVYIMFSPEGSIERVQYEWLTNPGGSPLVFSPAPVTPSSSVSLLVGRRELIPADTTLDLTGGTETENEIEKAKLNVLNLESRWVSIGASTGSVVTTENAFVRPSIPTVDFDRSGAVEDAPNSLDTRMKYMLEAQEFARGMRRIGGG